MKQYKGIIFNSVNVSLLNGELGNKVKENGIRTAVVTRKTRTEVKKRLKAQGLSVDVIIGGRDLNTRFKDYGKPHGDPMVIATAMMYLDRSEVAVLGDYSGDRKASEAAGIDYFSKPEDLAERLGKNEPEKFVTMNTELEHAPVTGIMGAICGDIIGSAYEFHSTDDYNFEPFVSRTHVTDDSVATLAVASWLMGDRTRESLVREFMGVCNRHPNAGYGHNFKAWLRGNDPAPYGGTTNGAMMRASACGWAATSLEDAMDLGKRSAEVSHNSEEGIHGAQAVAASIWMLRNGATKQEVKAYVENLCGYDLDMTVEEHRRLRAKEGTCSVSGPQAFRCWLEANTYEETIRNAVTLRTDADTVADIAGALAAATPGMEVPQEWADRAYAMMDEELKGIFGKFNFYNYETK